MGAARPAFLLNSGSGLRTWYQLLMFEHLIAPKPFRWPKRGIGRSGSWGSKKARQ